MRTSTLYTMGMALDRSAENGYSVDVLVDGQWLAGRVAASDGTGVVVEDDAGGHTVVRTDRISAVRVHAQSPYEPLPAGDEDEWVPEGTPRAMPGPRTPGS